ncbi:MAG: SRPBCC domain-containing protein [Edaphobacter sp.]
MGDSRSVVEDGLLEMSLTRRVSAPLEIVFRAWTDARQLAEWWGPKGFTNPVCEADARAGGAIRIHMRAPDGVVYPMTGRYVEIDRPHRLVFTTAALDGEGRPMFEVRNTVTFTAVAGGTEIALVAEVTSTTPSVPQYLSGMSMGWSQSLDRLGALVARL